MPDTLIIDFTCECDTDERTLYVVTDLDGIEEACSYCEGCAALASDNFNGETTAIRPATAREQFDAAAATLGAVHVDETTGDIRTGNPGAMLEMVRLAREIRRLAS